MKSAQKKTTGAEEIHWDLGDLYAEIDDPAFANDQVIVLERAQSFATKYRGRIADLSASEFLALLNEYEAIQDMAGKIGSFAYLLWSTNTQNAAYGKTVQSTNELGRTAAPVRLKCEWVWWRHRSPRGSCGL